MSQLNQTLTRVHQPMDKGILRALVMIVAFLHVGLFMWEPEQYAQRIGGFEPWLGVLFVLSLCSSMVYGIGFKPRFWLWQTLFSPYIPSAVLTYLSILCL
ncbi:cyd operon protein YbgE [Vibrio sp. SCSIO 43136]|uniref:cyd operon protein YbgE n=1 Tax=Vibrio sp. SCSIO 43136 TaxID=2819101 RepID=UPI0020764C78|nr:cyd operon protein YbgE [Vibrio sp. SCSIO 43136]USD64326.1 cyd operon protein YbgE [Vibrio sp. SCSIO 43136]